MHDKFALGVLAAAISLFVLAGIPNLREERNRSRQKRTMADMRTIASALEARATDRNSYGIGTKPVCKSTCEFASLTGITLDELAGALSPVYIRKLPRVDGWGNEFEVRVSERSYAIRSAGSDGIFEPKTHAQRTIESFEEDVVFRDGNFTQYPEGT